MFGGQPLILCLWQLWNIRLNTAERYQLHTLYAIIKRYRTAGMSSDEEDEENPGTYAIAVKPWRALVLTQAFRALDRAHITDKRQNRAGGHKLRTRVESERISARSAVQGLWRNGYSEIWKQDCPTDYENALASESELADIEDLKKLIGPKLYAR